MVMVPLGNNVMCVFCFSLSIKKNKFANNAMSLILVLQSVCGKECYSMCLLLVIGFPCRVLPVYGLGNHSRV